MDTNQLMQLASNPQVRQLLQSLFAQFSGGRGGSANLSGLLNQLSQGGLQDQVQSWVSSGQNTPVSPDQLQQALGPHLEAAAAQAGEPPQQAASQLAAVLPPLVDQASPTGQLPDAQQLQDTLGKLLQPARPS